MSPPCSVITDFVSRILFLVNKVENLNNKQLYKRYFQIQGSLGSRIVLHVHITLISSNGVVCLERLSGAWYCISRPANRRSSYTYISYHDRERERDRERDRETKRERQRRTEY